MTTINSEVAENSVNSDQNFGGFTIVRDKLRYKKEKVQEILPHWITNSVACSGNIEKGVKVRKMKEIDDQLSENLKEMGIKRLFPVQSSVIPYIINFYNKQTRIFYGQPRDICISAPTGSGKTLAYVLPIIQLLNPCKSKVIRAVIILPVRDLAKQVAETIKRLIVNMQLRAVLLTGEESFTVEQEDIFLKCDGKVRLPDIVICTPGRLVDHIFNTPDFCLEHVRFLVIDEADRVIVEEKQDWYNTFESAVYGGINQPQDTNDKTKLSVKRRFPMPTVESQCTTTQFTLQKILLSATLTHDPEPLKRFRLNFPRLFLASSNKPAPGDSAVRVKPQNAKPAKEECDSTVEAADGKDVLKDSNNVASGDGGVGVFSTPSGLKEFFVEVIEKQKPMFLAYLVKKLGHTKVLCFTNSRETTKRLAFLMSRFGGVKAEALNAGMPLAKRTRLLNSFGEGCIQILVCTDAVARGIDIEDVSCVVSYEPPQSVKTYVHRIGRTARAGKAGQAFVLLLHNQIRHFKSSLKSVGKHAKNFVIHASKLRAYSAEYKKALAQLESEFHAKATDAFGVVKGEKRANLRNQGEPNFSKAKNSGQPYRKSEPMEVS